MLLKGAKMPTISEPQGDIRNQSFETVRAHFVAGRIGEATFRVSMQILGILPRDIHSEIALAMMERDEPRRRYATEYDRQIEAVARWGKGDGQENHETD